MMQIKRKAERTSKNHIKAKSDWREKLEKLESGEICAKDLNVRPKNFKPAGTDPKRNRSLV